MVSNSYLKNRNGHFYLRYRIPSDLSPLIPQVEIVKSLKTSDLKSARVSALPYVQGISQTFSLLRSKYITVDQANERICELLEKRYRALPSESVIESHRASMEPVLSAPVGILLSEFIQTYTKDKGQVWTPKSQMEMKGIFKLLVDLIGDVPIESISRDKVRELRDNLQKLPPNVSKLYPDLSPLEVIKQIDGAILPPLPTLSLTSVNKHLAKLSFLMLHAVREGLRTDNPVSDMRIKQKRRQDEERKAYDLEDIKRIADHLPRDRSKPERLWVPMICMLGGLRLDEACQLYKEDIVKIDGIWCFDINESKDKKLKNLSSNRIIPVHPKLIAMGLIDYVDSCGSERLWNNLTYCKINGYSNSLGKWYQRFNREYITMDKLKTLHSLRHSFADTLKQLGVQESLIAELVGHSTSDFITMSRYGKRFKPEVLLEVIKKVDYNMREV